MTLDAEQTVHVHARHSAV